MDHADLSPETGLCFANPGLLDLHLLTTFGVSVKPNGHPIGKFGTGLKYALAGLVRLGAIVDIWIDQTQYRLGSVTTPLRGEEHELLYLYEIGAGDDPASPRLASATALPFAASLGAHWTPWMIYRELWSNAMDEQGEIFHIEPGGEWQSMPGATAIVVGNCPSLVEIANNEDDYIIPRDETPVWISDWVEAYAPRVEGEAERGIFFRGIKVLDDEHNRWAMRWNIIGDVPLTEDRTLSSTYGFQTKLGAKIWTEGSEALWSAILAKGFAETKLAYATSEAPGPGTLAFWRAKLHSGKHGKSWAPEAIRKKLIEHWGDEIREAEDAIEIPTDFASMLAGAPPASPSSMPYSGFVSGYSNEAVDTQLRSMRAEIRYWKGVAKALAGQLGLPAKGIQIPEPEPGDEDGDDVPF